ncbi:MAG: prephenate dehydratase domain-containing protein [Acidimicrobiia bacterium]|nr:prephenate dehydratase domain-containing protein [Acidimicrobiia bacterium]
MRVGYQGEAQSYSHRAVGELFGDAEALGLPTFAGAFAALAGGAVDRLVLPIENSTTGSVLPVLDRLVDAPASIVAEHRVEVRHALVGVPGAELADVQRVRSHPEALAQAESMLTANGWAPVPAHDTAGAVREVAAHGDPAEAALAPPGAARSHGLVVLMEDVVDREHNTTRFVVLAPGDPVVPDDADKSSVAFQTQHRPGALALALTELGLRGANLTRIESRPSGLAWSYRFFVDLLHLPGPAGLEAVLEPPLATVADFHHLGSYRADR